MTARISQSKAISDLTCRHSVAHPRAVTRRMISLSSRIILCVVLITACTACSTRTSDGRKATAATISASPNPIPFGAGAGNTKISWNTGDDTAGEVFLSVNGSPETAIARGPAQGSEDTGGIVAGQTYEFRLYSAGLQTRKLLATIKVTRSEVSSRGMQLPLYVSLVLMGVPLCAMLVLVTSYLLQKKEHKRLLTVSFLKGELVRFRWLLAILATTAVFFIANHLLIRGLGVGLWDVDTQFLSFQVLVADFARAGHLVLWDSWSTGGIPRLGDPQFGALSPLNVLIGLITGGTSRGFIAYWLLMWWLGGIGILMLARHLRAPAWGGCIVALGFLYCGVYTGQAEHTSHLISFSFLPFIIWRLDAALCSRRLLPAVEAGALWGLSALSGYPGLTIITGCFCGLWVTGRWLVREPFVPAHPANHRSSENVKTAAPTLRRAILFLVIMLSVGLAVLAPTYVAFFYEGAGVTTRVGALSRELATANSLHPGALSTFASPYLLIVKARDQLDALGKLWAITDVSMSSIYAGAIIPTLGLLALLRRPKDRWRWWLVGLGALSLACALGQTLPFRGWLYDWFYPMRFFKHPAIFRDYYVFSASVLALLGTRDLAAAFKDPKDRIWILFPVVSILLSLFAFLLLRSFRGYALNLGLGMAPGYVHIAIIWTGLCAVAIAAWLLPYRYKQWSVPVLLLIIAGSDALLTSEISRRTILKTSVEAVERWKRLDKNHSAAIGLTRRGLLREKAACDPPCFFLTNDQLITKVPVLDSYTQLINDFHLRIMDHPILTNMAIGTDRVWFSNEVEKVPATQSSYEAFVKRTEVLGAPPLLIHSRSELLNGVDESKSNVLQMVQIDHLPAAEKIDVKVLKYSPDELAFDVECRSAGWLLVTDRWARSWRAEVNGKRVTVYPGNYIFRAIEVSAGKNNVRFVYHPVSVPWLIVLSWGTLAVVVSFSVCFGWKSRRVSQFPGMEV